MSKLFDNKDNVFSDDKGAGVKIFNRERVDKAIEKIKNGYKLYPDENPFDTVGGEGVRKAKIKYELNEEEEADAKRCARDIVYFCNTHVRVKDENGIYNIITLRDYQKEIFELFETNRYSLLMASRQVGKCVDGFTILDVIIDGKKKKLPIGAIYWELSQEKGLIPFMLKNLYRLYVRFFS